MSQVLVVGSGVAAVAVSRRLLASDPTVQITLLEAGGDFIAADYRQWLDMIMSGVSPTRAYNDPVKDADINTDGGMQLRGGRMLAKGGTTGHWGGWCPRLKPEDFALGEVKGDRALNWAINYADFIDYYTQAEIFLNVCGDSTLTNPPRNQGQYPFAATGYSAIDGVIMPALERLGYGYEAMPVSRHPEKCRTTGTCVYCPFDAKYTAVSDLDRLLLEYAGRIELRLQSPVLAITMASPKQAAGVEVLNPQTGAKQFIAADKIIVAAGTIESTKLLLASVSERWPNGLGNQGGHLGKHLVTHPFAIATGEIPNNQQRLADELGFPTLACRHFDSPEYQELGKMYFLRYNQVSGINYDKRLLDGVSPAAIDDEVLNHSRVELRGMIEAFDEPGNEVGLAPGTTALGLPRTKIQHREPEATLRARKQHHQHLVGVLKEAGLKNIEDRSFWGNRVDHATSTCRMSVDAADGVVDGNLRVHDTDNLYLCSNAVFPNCGAVNPTLTLVGLALRLGNHLASA
ncbi:GMC family oxidoreductase [Halioxenophilus sp. WMMB6]|uniref:GMC family oxidoreductase n=1 Tax=Halioxenophilus sp. WMMB6 TaxID=3073815 RepID=UPI00295EB84E|nr:GMC family oxidoreductase [Halioxenophilus sp. WMMB6]